ncbi:YggT family protein [Parachlamydia sp. AcF125]|uniref:YggT family protein n=1 Tax=Parachlamydia sp. AcF125 TaxID=2795736 RepID=UPI001BC910F4|nr:YggT family protein [Parachlamydia sp. AcF125]MBS4167873.1 hypothetical protein [Parachlamydia sp. AcF125]
MILINLVSLVFQTYFLMLFARILSSWIPELHQYRMMQFIAFYTDPYLNFFRRFIPPLGMIDISPIFAFMALSFMEYFLKIVISNLPF